MIFRGLRTTDTAVMRISELNCQKSMIEYNQLVRRVQVEPCSAGISKIICSHKSLWKRRLLVSQRQTVALRRIWKRVASTKAAAIRLGMTRTGRQQPLPRTKTTTQSHALSSRSWKLLHRGSEIHKRSKIIRTPRRLSLDWWLNAQLRRFRCINTSFSQTDMHSFSKPQYPATGSSICMDVVERTKKMLSNLGYNHEAIAVV